MDRHKITPASYGILEKDNKVLLMKRANSAYFDGYYGLPSGHVEENETPTECVIREVKEEVGVDVKGLECVNIVYSTLGDRGAYVTFIFKISEWEGEPEICETEKCDDLGWFAYDDLPENIVPEVKAVFENLKEGKIYSEV